MTFLDHALALAAQGFHVFPLRAGGKLPAIKRFPELATRDEATIRAWWTKRPTCNVGIFAGRYGDEGESLIIIDVDCKNGKNGYATLLAMELAGKEFPDTYTQTTPTKGAHYVYRTRRHCRPGAGVMGIGVDVRAGNSYAVGAGSRIGTEVYSDNGGVSVPAPGWIEDHLHANDSVPAGDRPAKRAVEYLKESAPLSVQGEGGDETAYKVAARLKDLGVDSLIAYELMQEHWNDRCSPPWAADELLEKVKHAYRYGQNILGSADPTTQFDAVREWMDAPSVSAGDDEHPFTRLNRSYAFVLAGGGHHILWETRDADGKFKLEHLAEGSFHKKHASQTLTIGDGKTKPLTALWVMSPERRSYDGLCFRPGVTQPPFGFYNLWRGFSVEPAASGDHPSVAMFLEHAERNVCRGDAVLLRWLLSYFAHLVQRPGDKPLVAMVFRGGKGVGKNALVDRIGALLGAHYLLSSNRRYLVGNFNGHLENLLLFALDEAFWSGDKQAEGILKDLITGDHHVIEHKGREPYKVDNCLRVAIIGNEDWLVPASHDERRYAVFDVGSGRQQDRVFFHQMRVGMEQGGYAHLLRFLLDFDISGIDLNAAPATQALHDQKVESLEPFLQWWLDCLHAGSIVGAEFSDGQWPEAIDKTRFRSAFERYCTGRRITARRPSDVALGRMLGRACRGIQPGSRRDGKAVVTTYVIPSLAEARSMWAAFIGHEIKW